MAKNKSAVKDTVVVDLDDEESIGAIGSAGKVVPASSNRKTGATRKAPEEHPSCPHCGAKMHWNGAAAAINFECWFRQYALAKGLITDVNARLPVWTDDMLDEMLAFRDSRKRSRKLGALTYGKMETATGAKGTYASLKATASAAELADEVEPSKAKKGKKDKTGKAKATSVIPVKGPQVGKPAKLKKSAPSFDMDDIDLDLPDQPVAAVSSKKSSGKKSGKTTASRPNLTVVKSDKTKPKKIKTSAVAKSDKANKKKLKTGSR